MQLSEPEIKTNRLLLLLILILDLVGFSLIFPLVPHLLDFYLKNAAANPMDQWLPPVSAYLNSLLPAGGEHRPEFIVFMGGILASIYSILQFITSPYWGKLSDKIGRRPVLLITSLGLAFSYLVWFFSTSFTLFMASRVLSGLFAGNMGVASAGMADMSSKENRTREMGMVGAAFGVGFIIGPAIGGLAAGLDFSSMFPGSPIFHPYSFCALLSFLLSLASALLNWGKFKETLPERGSQRPWVKNPLGSLKGELNVKGLSYLLLLNFLYILTFSGFEFTMTFFYKLDFDLSPGQIGLVFVYIGVLIALGQGGLVRRLAPRMGEKRLAIAGFILLPLPLYLFSLSAPSVYLSLLWLLPIALGSSMVQPALTGLASLITPDERQGVALGVFRSAGSLARAIGPIIGAYLYWTLGVKPTYIILSALMFLTLVLALKLKNVEKSRTLSE